ncbi:hypothetical protein PghCCS26_61760 [Paenibacillus glycanilyticus]|uniref:Transposase n=1 Tax=Paenibacillus glycanilyticus TaxID=126569 RepID=A0ABQ6NVH2_9BACL|nr:hypothetical protein PghCCS26_61760 [Paenibacillus glycanilyticus]
MRDGLFSCLKAGKIFFSQIARPDIELIYIILYINSHHVRDGGSIIHAIVNENNRRFARIRQAIAPIYG